MRRRDLEAEPCTVGDAGWNRDANGMPDEPSSAAAAREAGLGPHFSAPTAATTRALDRQLERDDGTATGFTIRQAHFVGHRRLVTFLTAEKRVAHALEQAFDGRKVDRDFVLEAVGSRITCPGDTEHGEDRLVAEGIAFHAQSPSTIEVGPTLVKTPAR